MVYVIFFLLFHSYMYINLNLFSHHEIHYFHITQQNFCFCIETLFSSITLKHCFFLLHWNCVLAFGLKLYSFLLLVTEQCYFAYTGNLLIIFIETLFFAFTLKHCSFLLSWNTVLFFDIGLCSFFLFETLFSLSHRNTVLFYIVTKFFSSFVLTHRFFFCY